MTNANENSMTSPKMVTLYFALVMGLIILIVMQVFKVGYYKNTSTNYASAAERMSSPGVEIPPNYLCGTEGSTDVVPNSYVYGTGGATRGAAARHGQVASDYSGDKRDAQYIYTSRMDKKIRDYSTPINPAFSERVPGLYAAQ